jgi:hypothetical protein
MARVDQPASLDKLKDVENLACMSFQSGSSIAMNRRAVKASGQW